MQTKYMSKQSGKLATVVVLTKKPSTSIGGDIFIKEKKFS